jgi:hypothetical protein
MVSRYSHFRQKRAVDATARTMAASPGSSQAPRAGMLYTPAHR